MTTALNRNAAERAMPAPATTPLPGRLPRRRRWGMVALGVVLAVIGAVVGYLLVLTAGVTRPYLAVSHNLPYGATFGPGDLTVVDVNPAAGLQLIPAGQRDQIIGKHAATDLFAGTLLSPAQVTNQVIPAPGQELVGIALKPGQLPARTLKIGDSVNLVVVPPSSITGVPDAQASAVAQPSTIRATIAGTAPPETNGNIRVDVAVTQADGPAVAALAAAGRIAIVVTNRR
jgi:hypothetical protein